MDEPESRPVPASPRPVEDYHKSSRLRVIATITAAVVGVGVLGGLAGVAFDPDPSDPDLVTPVSGDLGSGAGRSVTLLPRTGGDPAGALRGAALPDPRGTYKRLVNGVQVFVPRGWHVDYQKGVRLFQSNGKGSYSFTVSGKVSPSTSAGALLTYNLGNLLPPENYTQLEIRGPVRWGEPVGTLVSTQMLEYRALWVDNQGSAEIYGQIYAAVRRDGRAVAVLVEHIPPERWDETFEPRGSIPYYTVGRLGGVL